MSNRIDDSRLERLSAFLDGELSEQEQNALAEQLAGDKALRSQLTRFQSVSARLQKPDAFQVDASTVAEAVSARLQNEPTVLAPRQRTGFRVPRLALGAALAASVAAVAISVAPQLLESGVEPLPQDTFAFTPRLSVPTVDATTVALGGGQADAEPIGNQGTPQRWKLLQPDQRNRLNKYLLEHNEFAGRLSVTHPNAHVGFISSENAQH